MKSADRWKKQPLAPWSRATTPTSTGPLFSDKKRMKVFDLERAEHPRFLWSQPHLRWKESTTEPLFPNEKRKKESRGKGVV
ncbi:hypothetical protein C4D60_Mb05t17370 [Musa balbisiana]|uniref:Uncharacterized protein n=1 Tax=Musa balbisiana TaxID=52838 RepID=A0A4S8JWT6_MUSBA|nr:hypothetical protein C4D60_Mb05t17370 [Musa balbisiana]